MKKLNQKGFTVLEIVLILFVILALAGVGYYVYRAQQTTNKSQKSTEQTQTSVPKTETDAKKETTLPYEVSGLGVKIKYPSDWGAPQLAEGTLRTPAAGSYKQLTFSSFKKVNINFVVGAYSSPSDGCGPPPIESAKDSLNYSQASVIGWDDLSIKRYTQWQGTLSPAVTKEAIKPTQNTPGWVVVAKKDKVLEYIHTDDPKFLVKAGNASAADCHTVTKAEADEANAYRQKTFRYAANIENSNFKGVNALYDVREGENATVRTQLIEALNSIQ